MSQEHFNDNFDEETNHDHMVDSDQESPKSVELKSFDGFPYLVTRVAPAIYHIILIPSSLDDETTMEVINKQVVFNRLETCLVKNSNSCIYFPPHGEGRESKIIPMGGTVISNMLAPSYYFDETEEFIERGKQLKAFQSKFNSDGYIFGDLSKGGRQADVGDLMWLTGDWNGIPGGLERCDQCGDYRGECLDPSPNFKNMVMRVSCLCENINRCASCGEYLNQRKLNANYFDPKDGQLWHVPGFLAFNHKCPE